MFRGEIHLDPVKKMVYWVSNKPKQAKTGQNGPVLRTVEAVKVLDPMR